ncbi:hypothetical protein [Halocalculus aciditolerans]|uniref:Uncharacterized protein n=1 Tax=Halocalculus aciditolerans TaxID=1383812 RepID=A0A830FGK9_9EURY|nr:hypothetical protein [Halocalculus aciditolerans]GGL73484.1 hypothetical protein GCM10009039_34500 [Halocalculus aciditolerans]
MSAGFLSSASSTKTEETDERGRFPLGLEFGGATVTFAVVDPDTLERLGGPDTETVPTDGRLSLGSEFANREVTLAILSDDRK